VATAIRNPAQRLRQTVDALPERTRVAMLRGISKNRIIVGAYTDPKSGGICPMLAAHRNGGRTSLASFAVAWDAFTNAKRPRRATRREVRTLRSYLEISLLRAEQGTESIAELADRIRGERAAAPPITVERRSEPRPERRRWASFRAIRKPSDSKDLITAAQEELSV
jgi:hypothetical protein